MLFCLDVYLATSADRLLDLIQFENIIGYEVLLVTMLPVKIPWQVQQEINIENGVTFFAKFVPTLCCSIQYIFKTAEQIFMRRLYHNNKCNEN